VRRLDTFRIVAVTFLLLVIGVSLTFAQQCTCGCGGTLPNCGCNGNGPCSISGGSSGQENPSDEQAAQQESWLNGANAFIDSPEPATSGVTFGPQSEPGAITRGTVTLGEGTYPPTYGPQNPTQSTGFNTGPVAGPTQNPTQSSSSADPAITGIRALREELRSATARYDAHIMSESEYNSIRDNVQGRIDVITKELEDMEEEYLPDKKVTWRQSIENWFENLGQTPLVDSPPGADVMR